MYAQKKEEKKTCSKTYRPIYTQIVRANTDTDLYISVRKQHNNSNKNVIYVKCAQIRKLWASMTLILAQCE